MSKDKTKARTYYVAPPVAVSLGRAFRRLMDSDTPSFTACMECEQPRESHRSRHSVDSERRNRCPKREVTQ